MGKTWKLIVVGILELISGAIGSIAIFYMGIAISITSVYLIPGTVTIPKFVPYLLRGISVPLAISPYYL